MIQVMSEKEMEIVKVALEDGKRVGDLAYGFSKFLGLPERDCVYNQIAGKYHDVGKCRVPYEIVFKPGVLSKDEFEVMKRHPLHSCIILKHRGVNKVILDQVKYHHEDHSGTGYPFGLKGEEIPTGARILKICDVFDALVSARVYKPCMTTSAALQVMDRENYKFDPELLSKFKEFIQSVLGPSTETEGLK